jgi:UDP-N-acetylglucosamine kinase
MSLQMPPERGPYELPEALREEIFLQVIVPDVLLAAGPERQERPNVVLLGGQPGAGKSTATHHFDREFARRGGLAVIDGDAFRPFHPAYEQLLAQRPHDLPEAIQATVRWWSDRATDYLRARRYNILLQGRFGRPDRAMKTAEQFAAAGYNVRVAAMAVPAALSRLGIIERYASQLDHAGTGRWTPARVHDENYEGTREVLRLAATDPAVHRITVLTRDGIVYDRPTDRWPSVATPVDVLEEGRAPFSRLQRTALANRLADTLDHLRAIGAGHDDLYDMAAAVHDDLMANAVLAGQAPGYHGQSVSDQLDAALADLDKASAALDASTPPPDAGPELPEPPWPDADPGPA